MYFALNSGQGDFGGPGGGGPGPPFRCSHFHLGVSVKLNVCFKYVYTETIFLEIDECSRSSTIVLKKTIHVNSK